MGGTHPTLCSLCSLSIGWLRTEKERKRECVGRELERSKTGNLGCDQKEKNTHKKKKKKETFPLHCALCDVSVTVGWGGVAVS